MNPIPNHTDVVQNQAGASPALDQQRLVARRLSIVNVRGVDYEFSIEGSISGKRCDQLVKNHIEFLLTASGRNSFDSITSVFQENPNPVPDEPKFALKSSDVTYVGKKGKTKTKNAVTSYLSKPETFQKVKSIWDDTQRELTELSSGASSPTPSQTQPNSNPPVPPTNNLNPGSNNPLNPPQTNAQQQAPGPGQRNNNENQLIINYRNYAQNQIVNHTPLKIDEALASQISQMEIGNNSQGTKDYKGKNEFFIIKSLRDKYTNHINNNIRAYTQEKKFMEIVDNLVIALKNNRTELKAACEKCNSGWWSNTNLSFDQFEALLTPAQGSTELNFSNFESTENRNDLIKIHAKYINNGGNCINEKSFLDAFVEIHNPKSNADMFQVAIVTSTSDTSPRPYICPNQKGNIFEHKCALIFRDDRGNYYSLPRRTIPAPRPQIPTPTPTPTAKFFTDNFPIFINLEPAAIKDFILNALPNQNPEALAVLKCFVFTFDHMAWERDRAINGDKYPEPGTTEIGIYPPTAKGYAEYRLNAFDPTELKAFLLANKDGIIALCR